AGDAAVLLSEHRLYFAAGKFSQADLYECPNHAAAHFVQKSFAFDEKRQAPSAALEFTSGKIPHGGIPGITRIGCEGLEIMLADEETRRGVHRGKIEGAR